MQVCSPAPEDGIRAIEPKRSSSLKLKFRARQIPRPELPFLATWRGDEVAEVARDRLEIEWRLRGAGSDQLGSFS